MVLSDREIRKYLEEEKIKVSPKPDLSKQLGTSSLDLRLGNEFRIFENSKQSFVDTRDSKTFQDITKLIALNDEQSFVLHPNQFILAMVLEELELPDDIAARIDGRSSLGRLGIVIHSTAGHIDAGFKGKITLEMQNIGMLPVLLYPKMRICQLVFQQLSSPAEIPYHKKENAKYLNMAHPQESKLEKE